MRYLIFILFLFVSVATYGQGVRPDQFPNDTSMVDTDGFYTQEANPVVPTPRKILGPAIRKYVRGSTLPFGQNLVPYDSIIFDAHEITFGKEGGGVIDASENFRIIAKTKTLILGDSADLSYHSTIPTVEGFNIFAGQSGNRSTGQYKSDGFVIYSENNPASGDLISFGTYPRLSFTRINGSYTSLQDVNNDDLIGLIEFKGYELGIPVPAPMEIAGYKRANGTSLHFSVTTGTGKTDALILTDSNTVVLPTYAGNVGNMFLLGNNGELVLFDTTGAFGGGGSSLWVDNGDGTIRFDSSATISGGTMFFNTTDFTPKVKYEGLNGLLFWEADLKAIHGDTSLSSYGVRSGTRTNTSINASGRYDNFYIPWGYNITFDAGETAQDQSNEGSYFWHFETHYEDTDPKVNGPAFENYSTFIPIGSTGWRPHFWSGKKDGGFSYHYWRGARYEFRDDGSNGETYFVFDVDNNRWDFKDQNTTMRQESDSLIWLEQLNSSGNVIGLMGLNNDDELQIGGTTFNLSDIKLGDRTTIESDAGATQLILKGTVPKMEIEQAGGINWTANQQTAFGVSDNTISTLSQYSSNNGGLVISGFNKNSVVSSLGIRYMGYVESPPTVSTAVHLFESYDHDGAGGLTAIANTGQLLKVRNNGTPYLNLFGNGLFQLQGYTGTNFNVNTLDHFAVIDDSDGRIYKMTKDALIDTIIANGGGSSLFTDGGSTTYLTQTGDNFAIGGTTAPSKLSVFGSAMQIDNSSGTAELRYINSTDQSVRTGVNAAGDLILRVDTDNDFEFIINNTDRVAELNGGQRQFRMFNSSSVETTNLFASATDGGRLILRDLSASIVLDFKGVGDSYLLNDLGIGTASPNFNLHVSDVTASSAPRIGITNDVKTWSFGVNGLSGDRFEISNNTDGVTPLSIYTDNDVFITDQLGIGTLPSYALHVQTTGTFPVEFHNTSSEASFINLEAATTSSYFGNNNSNFDIYPGNGDVYVRQTGERNNIYVMDYTESSAYGLYGGDRMTLRKDAVNNVNIFADPGATSFIPRLRTNILLHVDSIFYDRNASPGSSGDILMSRGNLGVEWVDTTGLFGGTGSSLWVNNGSYISRATPVYIENAANNDFLRLVSTSTSTTAGDTLGRIEFFNSDISSPGDDVTAMLSAYAFDGFGRTGLDFYTSTGNPAALTRGLRVEPDNDVIIGDGRSSTNYALEVTGIDNEVANFYNSGSTLSYIRFESTGGNSTIGTNSNDFVVQSGSGASYFNKTASNNTVYVLDNITASGAGSIITGDSYILRDGSGELIKLSETGTSFFNTGQNFAFNKSAASYPVDVNGTVNIDNDGELRIASSTATYIRHRIVGGVNELYQIGGDVGSGIEKVQIGPEATSSSGPLDPDEKYVEIDTDGNLTLFNNSYLSWFTNGTTTSFDVMRMDAGDDLQIIAPAGENFSLLDGGNVNMFINGSTGNIGLATTDVGAFKINLGGIVGNPVNVPSGITLYEGDGTRNNRIIMNADATGAYIQSSFSSGGSQDIRFRGIVSTVATFYGGDSTIYFPGSVGIGRTPSPSNTLVIKSKAVGSAVFNATPTTGDAAINFQENGSNTLWLQMVNTAGSTRTALFPNDGSYFKDNLGIGNSGALGSALLHIEDEDGGNAVVYLEDNTATSTFAITSIQRSEANFAIQTRNNGGGVVADNYVITNSATGASEHSFYIASGEKVSINTTGLAINLPSASYPLDILGNVRLTSNVGINSDPVAGEALRVDGDVVILGGDRFTARVDNGSISSHIDILDEIRIYSRDSVGNDFSGWYSVTHDLQYIAAFTGNPSGFSVGAGITLSRTAGDEWLDFTFNNGSSPGRFPIKSTTTTSHVEWSAYEMPTADPGSDGNQLLNYDSGGDELSFKRDAIDIAPASLNGTRQDDYNPTGHTTARKSIILLSASSATDITGLEAKEVGEETVFINLSSSIITLKFQDTNSLSANRFQRLGTSSSDFALDPGESMTVTYSDVVAAGWYATGTAN